MATRMVGHKTMTSSSMGNRQVGCECPRSDGLPPDIPVEPDPATQRVMGLPVPALAPAISRPVGRTGKPPDQGEEPTAVAAIS